MSKLHDLQIKTKLKITELKNKLMNEENMVENCYSLVRNTHTLNVATELLSMSGKSKKTKTDYFESLIIKAGYTQASIKLRGTESKYTKEDSLRAEAILTLKDILLIKK